MTFNLNRARYVNELMNLEKRRDEVVARADLYGSRIVGAWLEATDDLVAWFDGEDPITRQMEEVVAELESLKRRMIDSGDFPTEDVRKRPENKSQGAPESQRKV
jgi:hypothetical protein